MALTFDSVTTAELAACTTKTAWCAVLIAALGSSRTITCKRAASGDAWADGTTFLAAPMTGVLQSTNGAVTPLGAVGAASTQLSADLSTGVSVLRISAGSRWVQGTLGLTGSGADFVLAGNPSATKGFGFRSSSKIKAPAHLPLNAPGPTGAYRTDQALLFQPVAMPARPSTIGGGSYAAGNYWLPTYSTVDVSIGWLWTNPGGDWIDANGTAQGSAATSSFAANAVSGGAAVHQYDVDLTAALNQAFTLGKPAAYMIRRIAGSAPRSVAGLFGAYARPDIAVVYQDGTTATLQCRVIAASTSSSSLPVVTGVLPTPVFIEWDRPTKLVVSASAPITVTEHWSGSGGATLAFMLCTPPVAPITEFAGLASEAGPLDEGIEAVSGVIGAQRYLDGTTNADFMVAGSANIYDEANYDPAFWGGAPNLSKWPHTVVGKWLNRADPNVAVPPTLVPSTYEGEGFEPLYPGLGAIKVTMPDDGIPTGGQGGSFGTTACNMHMLLPAAEMGTLDTIFVRQYVRLGTMDIGPADRRENLQGTDIVWADLAGKAGITPAHLSWDGSVGVNSGGSGGGYGYQLRFSERVCDEDVGGPDDGGVALGWHTYDFQGRNPVGHRYGDMNGGHEPWGQRGGRGGIIYGDRWYCVDTEVRLNSVDIENPGDPGKYWSPDGVLRTWIDDCLCYEKTGMVMRTLPRFSPAYAAGKLRPMLELGITELWWNWFHGGKTRSPKLRHMFVTGLVYAKQRIGRMNPPSGSGDFAWAHDLTPNTFVEQPNTAFLPWANAGGIPAGAYLGSRPFQAIIEAYSDVVWDPVTSSWIYFGGGHSDGTCNAVVAFSTITRTWRLIAAPTPPAKYIPSGGYPSGADLIRPGYYQSANELTAPEDLPYAAPELARAATHMYGGAALRQGKIYFFYDIFGVLDITTGKWSEPASRVSLGAQLYAMNTQYGIKNLQQGTVAHYDAVTDRFFVTSVPGDEGYNWRNHLLCIRPESDGSVNIETLHSVGMQMYSSISMVAIGRKLFLFMKVGGLSARNMNTGVVFDMDTRVSQRFTLVGDLLPNFAETSFNYQECVPAFYDGSKIHRWSYYSDRNYIFSVNPVSEGGAGSAGDPLQFRQTRRDVAGAPAGTRYAYKRFMWIPGANCAWIHPTSTSNGYAIKLP